MNSKFSWALVISAIIASVFAYFAVMGGIYHYWYVGNLIKPLLWGLGLWISIVVSVKLMCCSKTYKSKKASRRLEWIVGCILFAVLWVGSIFFLNFWNIYADRKDISEEMKEVCKSAEALDKAYEKYVKKRIRNYGINLELNRVDMDIPISEASLKRRILPDSLKTEVQKRHEWLTSMEDVNVFNPITPFNIQKLENGFEEWTNNYEELSKEFMLYEDVDRFNYVSFHTSLEHLKGEYRIKSSVFTGLMTALIMMGLLLFPWYIMVKPIKFD